jgi:hypothetical protein
LQSLLIRQREQSLYNRAKAYEHHKQLQQIPEPGIGSKAVDGPKADCSNDNNDQYTDQNRNDAHSAQLLMMPKISICGLYRRVNIERLPQASFDDSQLLLVAKREFAMDRQLFGF